ncbi:MAG: Ig-like domain-containing protein, partial [Desulfobacteraceae bacterium]|nr:Ig-like domain-containing protein [Desulfobacteraceae bacterium]
AATAGSTTGAPVSATDPKLHNACTACHDLTTGLLRAVMAPGGTVNISKGDCVTCHGQYFPSHQAADHSVRVGTDPNCVGCHTATAGTTTGVPVSATDPKLHKGCNACHDLTTGSLLAVKAPGGTVNISAGNCDNCHGAYFLNHVNPDHSTNVAGAASCVTCHTATAGTTTGMPVSTTDPKVHTSCSVCHNATTGVLLAPYGKAIAISKGDCINCHGSYFPNHVNPDHTTLVVINTNCSLCHASTAGSTTGAPVSATDPKLHNACTACHDLTTGLIRTVIAPGGTANIPATGGDCVVCHGQYFPSHKAADHSARVASSTGCIPCHAANVGTTTGAPVDPLNPKVHTACTVCHNADGSLKAAYGKAIAMPTSGGQCTDCHGAYFPNHTNINHTTYVALNANCAACHAGTAGTTTTVPVSTTDPKLHKGCNACHDITAGTLLAVVAPGGTANIPATGGDCVVCHGQYFYSHVSVNHTSYVVKNTLTTPPTSNCTGCHVATTAPFVGVGEVHAPKGCAECHNADGSLAGAAVGHLTGSECITCHSTYFTGHLTHSATSHDTATRTLAMRSTDLSAGQPCNNCHRRGGPATTNPLFTNTWGGTDGIYALHQLGCTECHDSTRTINLKTGYATVQAIIMDNNFTAIGCLDCHADRVNGHSHPATDFTWGGTCNQCHTGTSIVADVHQNQCGLCHVNPAGGGTRRVGTDGDATLAGTSNTASCIVCHDSTKFPAGSIHHDTNSAVNNNCVRCHDGVTFPSHPAPNHSTFVVNVAPCSKCHVATAGTTTGQPISSTDPMVHNACRTCHTFDANKNGILVNFTNTKGVNGTGALPATGGTCVVCHTQSPISAFHHDDNRRVVGQCEYCHADPRPVWTTTKVGDNVGGVLTGVGSQNPTHLACENCHVRWTGTAGNYTMTVNKFTRTSYTSLATAWTTTAVHTFTGMASNKINSYGACFGCHDGVTTVSGLVAPNVQVWHARPDRFGGTTWAVGSAANAARGVPNTGTAWYAAGRSSSGIGNMNLWFGTGASGNTSGYSGYQKLSGSYQTTNQSNLTTYNTTKSAAFLRITVPTVAGKDAFAAPQTSPAAANTYSVPVFAQVAQAAGTSYAEPDYVSVSSAIYDGTNITVTATHTVGACSTLTAAYGTVTGAMSGTGTCTATLSGATYPTGGTTVNVTSSNVPSIGVSGYRITNNASGAVSLSATTYSVLETAGVVSVTVNRTGGSAGAASVNYATSNGTAVAGTNYTTTTGTLSWAAGDMAAKVFTIPIINDNLAAGNHTVNITLSGNVGATMGTPATAVLTIVDVPPYVTPTAVNDAYSVAINSTTALSVLTNDTEPNSGYTLSISAVTAPTGGSASVMTGNTQIQYFAPATPGTYTFTYTITDQGGGTATATVTVTVN